MTWTGPRCPTCGRAMNVHNTECCDCAGATNDDEKEAQSGASDR